MQSWRSLTTSLRSFRMTKLTTQPGMVGVVSPLTTDAVARHWVQRYERNAEWDKLDPPLTVPYTGYSFSKVIKMVNGFRKLDNRVEYVTEDGIEQ
jgi:hypothetical protein